MSLDKAIRYHKEFRKPYRGAKAIDGYCRNHGDCPYCLSNRLHKFIVSEPAFDPQDEYDIDYRIKPRNLVRCSGKGIKHQRPSSTMSMADYRRIFGELLKR